MLEAAVGMSSRSSLHPSGSPGQGWGQEGWLLLEQGAGGEGSCPQWARLLSKHTGLNGCPSSSSWPGWASRRIYGLTTLLEEVTQVPPR